MTNTNYPAAFAKFQQDVKAAVTFHHPDFTHNAITRHRAKLLQAARVELLATLPEQAPASAETARTVVFDKLRPRNADTVAVVSHEWAKFERLVNAGRNLGQLIAQADERRLAAILDMFPTSEFADSDEGNAIVAEVQELTFRRLVDLCDPDAVKASEAEKIAGREVAWDRVLREAVAGDVTVEAWTALHRVAPEEQQAAQGDDPQGEATIAQKIAALDARSIDVVGMADGAE